MCNDHNNGRSDFDLVLKNARIVDVITGNIISGDIAISNGRIADLGGEYKSSCSFVDVGGSFVAPGFIDAHCHVESSMAAPPEYCRAVLRNGVTTVITDPHEIANIASSHGIDFMINASQDLPINYFFQLPSCVPATKFEHSGDAFGIDQMRPFLSHPRVLGLGEVMDISAVLDRDPVIMEKIALFKGRMIDGHAPALSGDALLKYCSAGIMTDHEVTSFEEAEEKIRAGLSILIREGSACKNLDKIVSGVVSSGCDISSFAFCTDDKHLSDIVREGSILYNVKRSIALGMDPIKAMRIATLNAAKIYGLPDIGAVSKGCLADLIVFDDLENIDIVSVYKSGVDVTSWSPSEQNFIAKSDPLYNSVHLPKISCGSFELADTYERYPVINITNGNILTSKSFVLKDAVSGLIESGQLRKIAVIERHHALPYIGVGLVSGYGLSHGAVATTVAHDSHNLIVVGDNSEDMLKAALTLSEMNGGYCIVQGGDVLGALPLPIGGLMSDLPAEKFISSLDRMLKIAETVGINSGIDPFTTLSFMALPVIPEIRITDMGMFDVISSSFI